MAHDGSPDGPPDDLPDDSYSEPTQYADYGGTGGQAYSESNDHYPTLRPSRAWYQQPAALIGLGVLTAAMFALLIYAIIDFTTAEKSRPAVTTVTSVTSVTSQATTAPEPSATTVAPPVMTTTGRPEPSTPTTASPSVTTVTETAIERRFPRLPNRLNPPPLYEPPPGQ